MSKIGRKPIDINGVSVELCGSELVYKGHKGSGRHILPHQLRALIADNAITLSVIDGEKMTSGARREAWRLWGLHRALLSNEITGVRSGFEKKIKIEGLGFKAQQKDGKISFSLGYSHKIDFDIPAGITIDIDKKTEQMLMVRGINKELVGLTCSKIRSMKAPEPYKGKGITVGDEVIIRKAGKTKS